MPPVDGLSDLSLSHELLSRRFGASGKNGKLMARSDWTWNFPSKFFELIGDDNSVVQSISLLSQLLYLTPSKISQLLVMTENHLSLALSFFLRLKFNDWKTTIFLPKLSPSLSHELRPKTIISQSDQLWSLSLMSFILWSSLVRSLFSLTPMSND